MPKGPKGEKRPADVIGAAITVAKIATGEMREKVEQPSKAQKRGQLGGIKGGKARAAVLDPATRQKIARKAAKARWATSARQGKKEHQ